MVKKLISVLLIAAMLTVSLPLGGMIAADKTVTQAIDPTVYYSDLFWGYDPSYFKTDSLTSYVRDTYDINFRVYAEYLESPDCFWTTIKSSLLAVTDIKEFVGLLSSAYADEDAENVYTYTTALDAANAEIIKRMFEDNNSDTFGLASKFAKSTKDFFSLFKEFKTDIIGEDALKAMTDEEIYEQLLEFVSSRGLFSMIDSGKLNTIVTTVLQDADKYTKWASAAGSALDAAQVLCIALMAENLRMEVINGIIETAPEDSALYDGMLRLRGQLDAGFVSYFVDQYLTKEALGMLGDALTDAALGSIAPLWNAVCIVAKLVAFAIPVPSLDEILLQKMLLDYSDTLYDIILARGEGMIYDEMYSSFTADSVEVFEGIFDMYVIANKCALAASQKLALDSNVGDLNYITNKYSDFNYDSLIKEVISVISAIPAAERQYKYYESWYITDTATFDYPTNEIENGKIYLCRNVFRGNLTLGYSVALAIPEEKNITIDGNITANGNSSVTNDGNLHITGTFRNEGSFTNNGIADIDGDLNAANTSYSPLINMSEEDTILYVGGNWESYEDYTRISAGTVILDGTTQQTVKGLEAYNLEVTNPEGIKYNSNINIAGGEYDLNGNPIDNNGHLTYVSTGTRFVPGSDYKDVCLVYQASLVLDYPFVGNLTLGGSSSLTIPENAVASIDGNITANGNSSVTNDGNLHITGTFRSEGSFTNNGIADIDGDLNAADSPYSPLINMSKEDTILYVGGNWESYEDYTNITAGTVILDGTTQQTVKGLEAYNLEVTNPEGIKYNSNINIVGGEYDLNGNPLDNNGHLTYASTGTRFVPGSDYKDVCLVYQASLVLDYPFVGNFTLGGSSSLTIPENAVASIDGNITANGNSSVTNDGNLHITGTFRNEGSFTNNGIADIDGDLNAANTSYSPLINMSEEDTILYVGGNWESYEDNTNISAGTVILDGTAQQTVKGLEAYNLEVTNPEGIKYNSNINIAGGEYDLNGNPLDNNGHLTYASTGTRFVPGSDYKDVCLVYQASLVLDYPFVGNLTLGVSSSLIIPENAVASIDGNITANGNSSVTNDGNLHITGTFRSEGVFTNNGIADIDGDLNAANTSYSPLINMSKEDTILYVGGNWESYEDYTNITAGTVILDGTTQQTVKGLDLVPVVIIENGSEEGIVIGSTINVSTLFDHKGNRFTLYESGNYSQFNDYDGDGLKDNEDPYPTVFEACITGHAWGEWKITTPATCVLAGEETRICTGCAATETEVIPATGEHTWGKWAVTSAPTCVIPGEQSKSCSACSKTETEDIPATGEHTFGDWTVVTPAECETAGEERKFCANCDEYQTQEISAVGHVWGEWTQTVPAGCESAGEERLFCDNCDETQIRELEPADHVWGEWIETTPPSAVTEGAETRYCANCDATETQSIPKSDCEHVWSDWTVSIEPSCNTAGIESRECANCYTTETQTIDATDHNWSEWEVTSAPSCAAEGEELRKCADCEYAETQKIPATQNHIWNGTVVDKPATCVDAGSSRSVCTVCKLETTTTLPATGEHTFGDWTVVTPAECEASGEERRQCIYCDESETKVLPALGEHSWGEWKNGMRYCSVCGETEEKQLNPFVDVKEGKWYTDGILYCYYNGYMAGTSETVFGYRETVTRAMFATVLAKIDGADLSGYTSAPFSDVADGKWYTAAIAWAAENEYAAGIGEGIYGYKNPVTREQLALFFYVYSENNGIDVSGRADITGFDDYGRIHAYALDAMSWAVDAGLISGTSETAVSPRASATRAEIPLIVMNFVENIKNAAR